RRLFYRVNNKKGRSEDVPFKYKEWIFHPSTDVAACEAHFPSRIPFNPIPFGQSSVNVEPGEDMFFVGLFEQFPGENSVSPIIRFGKICLPKTEVPIAYAPTKKCKKVEAYLVEAWSWGGESGSPAYSHYDYRCDEDPEYDFPRRGVRKSRVTASQVEPPLLGLLSGQFYAERPVTKHGVATPLDASTATGISVIIPADKIHELLMDKRFTKRRD